METPASTIDFQQSETSRISPLPEPDFRHSPSPFGRTRSPLYSRGPDYGQRSFSPLSVIDDPSYLQQMVSQLQNQVTNLQKDNNTEMDNVAQLRRRLNDSEREKLELTTTFNQENAELQGQVAKLRAQLEKGEAERQNVEYELALARKAVSQEKMTGSDKEQQLKAIITSQSEKLSMLSTQIQELQTSASHQDRHSAELQDSHRRQMDEAEKHLASAFAERDVLRTAKEEIEQVFQDQENLYADAQEKISELKMERDTQTQTVRQQLQDLQFYAEREEATKRELAAAKEEIKELQDRIEKERAAHTESKFNFEIVQCQKRDIEGALSVEKSAREQTAYNMEAMNKQIRELELAYQEERRECALAKDQLQRVKEEYASTRSMLATEIDQKKEVITGTSQQIDLYQKNFNSLKEELTKAKKRQIYLEETYGGSMRELELLLTNFQVMGEGNLRPRKRTQGKGKKTFTGTGAGGRETASSDLSPSLVLETLRHTLTDYQNRLDETSRELSKMSTLHEKLADECEHYKEVTITREHMVKDLQMKLTATVKELEKFKGQIGEKETKISRLKVKLQNAEQGHESEKTKAYSMTDEFIRQLSTLEDEQENNKLYLHSLYQRIVAGRVVLKEEASEGALHSFTWQELSVAVQDEVVQLMANLNRANEKIVLLECEIRTKKEQIHQLEDNHKEALDQLSHASKQREDGWRRQKQGREHQFQKQLGDLQVKSQKSKCLADDALSKARQDSSAKQELESQVSQFNAMMAELRAENTSVLSACALLSGALFPVYTRLNHLAAQRHLLERQVRGVETFKSQARELAQTLSMETGAEREDGRGKGDRDRHHIRRRSNRCLLLRFRVAAISIMAAHRLLYLAGQTGRLFSSSDNLNGVYAVPVCLGNTHMPHRTFSGMNSIASTRSLLEAQAAGWLTSPDLQTRVLASVADLQKLLTQSGSSNGPSAYSVCQAAATAFENLMARLAPCFSAVSALAPTAPPTYLPYRTVVYMERGPLLRSLSHGLNRLLAHSSLVGGKNCYITTEQTMTTLQNKMVDFLNRLHEAEVERRSLRKDNTKLRQEAGQLRLSSGIATDLQQEVASLQQKVQNSVGREKFDSVCQELHNALQRELEAQRLMTEQSTRLEEMGVQLNVKTTEELEKDHNITEAIKGLSEAKMELKRKEQSVKQLTRQLSQLDVDRRSLQDGMTTVESALRAATRDKESLVSYLRSVQSAVANTKHQLIARADSQTVDAALSKVQAQLLGTSVSSPDVIAVQNLIGTFIEAQKTAISRLSTLEMEISSHKQHIARLKEELSDACNRQMAEGEVTPATNGYGRKDIRYAERERSFGRFRPLYEPESSYKDVFVPLREVSDHSMQITSTPAMARQDYLAGVGMATPAGISSVHSSPVKEQRDTILHNGSNY